MTYMKFSELIITSLQLKIIGLSLGKINLNPFATTLHHGQ